MTNHSNAANMTAVRIGGATASKELLIAVVTVVTVALAITNSAFLVFAVCAGLAVASLFRFQFFVYGMVFLLPWYPLIDAKPPFHDVFLLLRFAFFGAVGGIRLWEGKPLREWMAGGKLKKGVLAFAGVALISLLVSSEHANVAAYRSLTRLFSYLAVFFAVTGWVETREQIASVVKVLLASTVGVALFGFYQSYSQSYTDLYFRLYPLQEDALEPWAGRITSLLFHFNSLAGYLNLVLPLAIACMTFAKTRWLRVLGFVCHSAALAALYVTGSRGGLIAYGGMLLVSIWFLKPKRVAWLRLCLSIVLAAGVVLSLQQPAAGERLDQVDDFTQESRLALWAAAGSMFLAHPVLGVGYGNYRSLYGDYIPGARPDELDAHNLYLQFLSETGIIGFLMFSGLMVAFARLAFKLARQTDPFYRMIGVALGGALVATLIHGMVDYIFNVSPQAGGLLWSLLALGWVTAQLSLSDEKAARMKAI
jgi:O-antigen ligase